MLLGVGHTVCGTSIVVVDCDVSRACRSIVENGAVTLLQTVFDCGSLPPFLLPQSIVGHLAQSIPQLVHKQNLGGAGGVLLVRQLWNRLCFISSSFLLRFAFFLHGPSSYSFICSRFQSQVKFLTFFFTDCGSIVGRLCNLLSLKTYVSSYSTPIFNVLPHLFTSLHD